jgi:hypothetical protein
VSDHIHAVQLDDENNTPPVPTSHPSDHPSTPIKLSDLFVFGEAVRQKIFGEHVLLGFEQELELHQLLDLDAAGDSEGAEGEGEELDIPLDKMTEQILLCTIIDHPFENSSHV